jgi:AraC-like DNA-binding protein
MAHLKALLAEIQAEGGDGEMSAALRTELLEAITRGEPRRSEVAARLGMSERTLSRRLRAEGKRYGEVLSEVRFELAERYLRDRDLAVYEVAFLLGYSEPSTFHRAFKRRVGVTPQAFRASA